MCDPTVTHAIISSFGLVFKDQQAINAPSKTNQHDSRRSTTQSWSILLTMWFSCSPFCPWTALQHCQSWEEHDEKNYSSAWTKTLVFLHQPPATIWSLLDQVVLLSNGYTMYAGGPEQVNSIFLITQSLLRCTSLQRQSDHSYIRWFCCPVGMSCMLKVQNRYIHFFSTPSLSTK